MKIKSIKRIKLKEPYPVCDLTVDTYHNFVLGNGVVVHNSANQARNAYNQEILKCRGKGLNVFKATLSKALANAEIGSLLIALGADEKELRKEGVVRAFRVGMILLFSDPDVDADHIDSLWLTWIYKFAPLAIELGMVYKVNVPLYQAIWKDKGKDKRVFGFSLDEIKEKAPEKAHITRFKGLGECSPEQLREFMDPETRHLTQITMPEAKKQIEEFVKIMGEDVQARKELLGIKPRS